MRVSVLAALALGGGVLADETSSPTRSPTMSFAPTLTVSPSFAPTGVPLCEPQCEYDYHLTSERMNKKILATVYRFCWILVALCGRRPWLPDVADGLSWAPSTCCFLDQFGAWWASMVLTWRAAVSAIVVLV